MYFDMFCSNAKFHTLERGDTFQINRWLFTDFCKSLRVCPKTFCHIDTNDKMAAGNAWPDSDEQFLGPAAEFIAHRSDGG